MRTLRRLEPSCNLSKDTCHKLNLHRTFSSFARGHGQFSKGQHWCIKVEVCSGHRISLCGVLTKCFWDFIAIEEDMLLFSPLPSPWTHMMLHRSCSWTSLTCTVTTSGVADTGNFLWLTFTSSWLKVGFQKCEHLQRIC